VVSVVCEKMSVVLLDPGFCSYAIIVLELAHALFVLTSSLAEKENVPTQVPDEEPHEPKVGTICCSAP
jgi:hypothetical protein